MTKYREILRLQSLGFSERNIAQSCGVSRNTVAKVLKKAAEINISWPLDFDMTDSALGVRVQGGNIKSDPTANKAVAKIMTTEALIKCDFSGDVLKGVDRAEEFVSDAYLLRKMRNDYQLFNKQVETLGAEKDMFEKYLTGEMSLSDIAELQNISYESAQQKIHKIRSRVRRQVIGFMDGKMGGIA